MGFLDWFFGRSSGRDGSAPAKAIQVNSVAEEYQWMAAHHPGYRPVMQALQTIEGNPYDVLTWQNDQGEKVTVYFDISRFFGQF